MKKHLLTGIAALFLATGTAHAEEDFACFATEKWVCENVSKPVYKDAGSVEIELCKIATDVKQVRVTGGLQTIAGTGATLKWGKRGPYFNGKRCRPDKGTQP